MGYYNLYAGLNHPHEVAYITYTAKEVFTAVYAGTNPSTEEVTDCSRIISSGETGTNFTGSGFSGSCRNASSYSKSASSFQISGRASAAPSALFGS